jgi:hypothetical protein
MILGVDTSSFAGVPDYSALYSQGARFIIPRCTMGLGVDKNAAHHARYAPREGLELLALYGWLDAALLGKAQAEHAFAVCETLDAPLFLDLEPPSKGPRPVDSPLYARKVAHDFLRRWFELAGVKAGIYGATSYIASLQLDPSLCGPLWGAIVGENGAPHPGPVPKVPPFASCAIHQFQHNVVVKSANEKPALIDWNRASHSVQELRVMLGATPNPYPSLGPVIDAVNGAMGIGRSVEDFVSRDEGPKVG